MSDCGEKYRLTRVVGVPETPAFWNSGGRAVHAAAEHFEREQFLRITPSIDETVDVFHNVFEDEVTQAEVDWIEAQGEEVADWSPDRQVPWRAANRGKEDDAWWREHGAGMVRAFVLQSEDDQTETAPTPDGQPAVEVEFNVVIAGVPFKGFVDNVRRLPGKPGLIIRDWKTGGRTPTSTTQLGEYGVSLNLLWGEPYESMRGEYYMARTARNTPRIQLDTMHPRSTVEYSVATAWFMKNAGLLLPRPSSFCKSCAVRDFCVYQDGARASEVPPVVPPRIG